MPLKIDLHVHSYYSYDSLITPKELVYYAKKRGLDGVAITDHDRIDGALKIARETDFFIIPGIEISSMNGHVVALNLEEPVSKGLDAEETVDRIHENGGLAIACHPVTPFKISLGKKVNTKFDAVEVINASALPFDHSVKRAKRIASHLGLPMVAGTDAHYAPEIGSAYTLVEAEPRVDEVVSAISKGMCEPLGNKIPLAIRLKREFLALKKRF